MSSQRPACLSSVPSIPATFLGALLAPLCLPAISVALTLGVPDPYPTIQSAVDAAGLGDTVLVAPGTYTGAGNRDIRLTREVVVRSSAGAESTVIDCQGNEPGMYRGFWLDGSSTEATVIEGLTIERGRAWGSSLDSGGAILCWSPGVTIRSCILTCNAVMVVPCTGGLARDADQNDAASGIGIGGAIFSLTSSPRIIDCVIAGNYAEVGTAIASLGGSMTIIRSVISGNGAEGGSSTISYYGEPGESLTITESTITGNMGGPTLRIRGSASVERSILWGNCSAPGVYQEAFVDSGATLAITCCAVDSSSLEGRGQVTYIGNSVFTDPLFCDPEGCQSARTTLGNYRLRFGSPCLPDRSPCGLLIGALGEGSPLDCAATSVPVPSDGAPLLSLVASPNPFRLGTDIHYAGSRPETGTITIHDVTGRRLRAFRLQSSSGIVLWDGTDGSGQAVADGVYFLRLADDGGDLVRRVTRIR